MKKIILSAFMTLALCASAFAQDQELLFKHMHKGKYSEVIEAIEGGAKPNKIDRAGNTLLHFAAWYDALDVAEVLLDHGAFVNAQARDKLTPLHMAAHNWSVNVARFLVANGADKTLRDNNRLTAYDIYKLDVGPREMEIILRPDSE